MAELDHLVYRVPNLLAGVEWIAAKTGVDPQPGGRHVGRGTANYLVGLGGRAYVEIIGPDPDDADFAGERPFGVSPDVEPSVITWAVRVEDIDEAIRTARHQGYDPGDPTQMERALPDGGRLRWRLTPAAGPVPFLIDSVAKGSRLTAASIWPVLKAVIWSG